MPYHREGDTMRRLLRYLAALVLPLAVVTAKPSPSWALDKMLFQANWLIQGENAYMVAGIK